MYLYLTTEPKRVKKKKKNLTELKGETENSTIIVGYFNTPLSVIDKITKQ